MTQVNNISTGHTLSADVINDHEPPIGLRKKRARLSPRAQKIRGKQGALKCLLEMPDDIMWEVTKLIITS